MSIQKVPPEYLLIRNLPRHAEGSCEATKTRCSICMTLKQSGSSGEESEQEGTVIQSISHSRLHDEYGTKHGLAPRRRDE